MSSGGFGGRRAGGGGSSFDGSGRGGWGRGLDGAGALEAVESSGHGGDLGGGVLEPGDLADVSIEEPRVCLSGPLREPLQPVRLQPRRLEPYVERTPFLVPGGEPPNRAVRSMACKRRLLVPVPAPSPKDRASSS